ncbi:MAG: hypothetical protein WBB01_09850 [Phormidesmis sp.]
MTVSANDAIDIKALLYALTQQREPLPEPLQQALQKAGRSLQQNQQEGARQLYERVKSYLPLYTAYRAALEEFDREYTSRERAKSLGATFANSTGADWFFINDVVPAADWVSTAKQILQTQPSNPTKNKGWANADRIAIMITGGASIGAAIAQLPGAIIGGLSAAVYGWYISFSDTKSSQTLK